MKDSKVLGTEKALSGKSKIETMHKQIALPNGWTLSIVLNELSHYEYEIGLWNKDSQLSEIRTDGYLSVEDLVDRVHQAHVNPLALYARLA